MVRIFWTMVALGLGGVASADDPPFEPVDYAKVPKTIAKEPTYVAKPKYALFLLGPGAEVRMWAVLDKSRRDLEYYDVLYLDLNANGDLTESGERFAGVYSERGARAGMALAIRRPELRVPGTAIVHRDFLISTIRKKGRKGIWFRMKWRGKETISGGYAPVGTNVTRWASSPATAPILRPTARGPFAFGLYAWGSDRWTLPVGKSGLVYVMLGNRGSGPDTLAVLDEDFLKLDRDELFATLISHDAAGEELRIRIRITGHC